MPRAYVQSRRAALVEDTRRRITEAAVHLHGTLGPARTTITAIAERAGVERLTVYRHFADEAAIFAACSAHWIEQHPPPDPASWMALDGDARCRAALAALYAYYADTADMWRLVYRDTPLVPAMQAPFAQWQGYLQAVADGLVEGFGVRARRRGVASAVARHVTAFPTWDDLQGQGVRTATLVTLMAGLMAQACAEV